MVTFRIPVSVFYAMLIIVIILAAVLAFLHFRPSSTAPVSIPSSIQYALEYFNAANQNHTLLVPSQYYKAAQGYSINGNRVVENDSLYRSILFGDTPLPKGYDILIDMANASSLSDLIFFPINFRIINISNSLRNCADAGNKTEGFAICSIYSTVSIPIFNGSSVNETLNIGYGTFVDFPNGTSGEINSTIIYNGVSRRVVHSVRIKGSNFYNGTMFVYENTTTVYLSQKDLSTFYGREMFLSNSTLKNVVANFFSARIVS